MKPFLAFLAILLIIIGPLVLLALFNAGTLGRKVLLNKRKAKIGSKIVDVKILKKGSHADSHFEAKVIFDDGTSYRDICSNSEGIFMGVRFWVNKEKEIEVIKRAIEVHDAAANRNALKNNTNNTNISLTGYPSSNYEKAYSVYKPEFAKVFFPNGKQQAESIIKSMAIILGVDLNNCDLKQYINILSTYTDVVTRIQIIQSSDALIRNSLKDKHSDLVKNDITANQIITFAKANIVNSEFEIKNSNDLKNLAEMANSFVQLENLYKENKYAEKEHLDDPEYGLVMNKPIYTRGINGSEEYLRELRTDEGEKLVWERTGSITPNNIIGVVDVYESKLTSGETYKILYINMYGSENSKVIPVGFSKENNIPRDVTEKAVINNHITIDNDRTVSEQKEDYAEKIEKSLEETNYCDSDIKETNNKKSLNMPDIKKTDNKIDALSYVKREKKKTQEDNRLLF